MPANRNPNVLDLLSWHGHDKGGVRVPFGEFGEPLGRVIATNVLSKLREAAGHIASGSPSPRWLFLVGGPGNGKSQMVEEFVHALGAALDCEESLVDLVASEFRKKPTPRKVEIGGAEADALLGRAFATRVARFVIVQDASASDRSDIDAASQLAQDLIGLLNEPRSPAEPPPVLICCINRGLLARTIMAEEAVPPVVDLLEAITRSTGLGQSSLQANRPSCWPVKAPRFDAAFPEMVGLVGSWPMDMESLLYSIKDSPSPAAEILGDASDERRWEGAACADCDSRSMCPFLQNARWLRTSGEATGTISLLRRQELATGQRWNFRTFFSLVAEIIVGEWDDFDADGHPIEHPCAWVEMERHNMADADPATALPAAYDLVQRLYPQALFAGVVPTPSKAVIETVGELPAAHTLIASILSRPTKQSKAIRRRLEGLVVPTVDPAHWSPENEADELYVLDDAYSQSVSLGNDSWPSDVPKAAVEDTLLSWLMAAEDECDQAVEQRPGKSLSAKHFVRRFAALIAKRSIAVRRGRHADEEYLLEYERTIRDTDRLAELQIRLRDFLSGSKFRADALSTFGQPEDPESSLVLLVSNPVRVFPIIPAPGPGTELPAHDLPAIPVSGRVIPLTYDLFVALRLQDRGCSSGSMPASVRAALDRLKQLYAGEACRTEVQFLTGETFFEIQSDGRIVVTSEHGPPRFVGPDAR